MDTLLFFNGFELCFQIRHFSSWIFQHHALTEPLHSLSHRQPQMWQLDLEPHTEPRLKNRGNKAERVQSLLRNVLGTQSQKMIYINKKKDDLKSDSYGTRSWSFSASRIQDKKPSVACMEPAAITCPVYSVKNQEVIKYHKREWCFHCPIHQWKRC